MTRESRAPKSLKLNAAMNMLKVVAGMIFPLITFPYTSRILGPEGTGKTNFASSLVAYFILLASIGIPLYGIREVAKVRDDRKALSALVQELLVLHGGAMVVSFIAFLGVIAFNQKVHAESFLFFIVSTSIPLSMLSMEWLYQGLEEYVYITVRSLSFTALSVVALFLFVHHEGDYMVTAGITVLSSLGSSVLNFWNARKIVFAKREAPWQFQRHFKPLGTVYALNFITSIYINLDTVMLGFMATIKSVGYYASAMKITKMLLGVVVSFGGVLLPRLAWYLANDKRDEFDRMLRKSLGVVLLLCLPITVALMLMSREILLVFAGAKYLPAADCLVVTAPIILFIGLTNIFGIQILYPLGKEKEVVFSVAAGAVTAAILNAILIPRFAHIGAAWGILIAECVVLAVQLVLVRQSYKVPWPVSNVTKYLLATALMGAVLLGTRHLVPEEKLWLRIAMDVPVGAGVYFSLLFLLKEEFVGEVFAKVKGRFTRG
jgi:O-antigen/teichoic acid export membrane protein